MATEKLDPRAALAKMQADETAANEAATKLAEAQKLARECQERNFKNWQCNIRSVVSRTIETGPTAKFF